MAKNLTPIQELVPHRAPMILIDQLDEVIDETAVCRVKIHEQSPFLEGSHVPALVGIEYMAQSVAAFGGYQALANGGGPKVGFLLGTPVWHSTLPGFPIGSELVIEATAAGQEGELSQFQCRILLDSEEVQTARLNVFHPHHLAEYLDQTSGGKE